MEAVCLAPPIHEYHLEGGLDEDGGGGHDHIGRPAQTIHKA